MVGTDTDTNANANANQLQKPHSSAGILAEKTPHQDINIAISSTISIMSIYHHDICQCTTLISFFVFKY